MPRISARPARLSRRAGTTIAAAALAVALAVTAALPGAADELNTAFDQSIPMSVTTELTSFPSAVIEPGQPVRVTVVVHNGGPTPLDGAELVVRATDKALAGTAEVDTFLSSPSGSMHRIARADVGTQVPVEPDPAEADADTADEDAEPETIARLGPGSTTTLTVTASADSLDFAKGWGVHGIVVSLVTPDGTRTVDTGVVTWSGDGIPTLELAAVAVAAGDVARVRAVAAAADVPGVALAVDPGGLSAFGSTDTALPAADVFRLPALNPDLASLAHADDASLLDFALDRSDRVTPEDAGHVPWLAVVGAVDEPTLALAHQTGAAGVLVDRSLATVPATEDLVTPAVRRADVEDGSIGVLLPEPTLSEQVAGADQDDPTSTSTVLAHAALLAGSATSPALVSPGIAWETPADGASDALGALMEAPFIDAVSVTALLADQGAASLEVPDVAGTKDDAPVEQVDALSRRLAGVHDLAATAEDPTAVLDPSGMRLLAPLATRLRGDDEARDVLAHQAADAVDATLDSLGVAAGSDINLIASKGSVPVSVRNELDVPASVIVDVTSRSPNLQIRSMPTATVPAGAVQTVLVEVEAVSSADVEASIVLRNPEGTRITEPVTLNIRVRADWGTAVTAVFTALLVLLLVAGVWRTVRRGRKDTRTGPGDPEELAEAEATSAETGG